MRIRFIAVDRRRVGWGHVMRQRKVKLYSCTRAHQELYGAGGAEVWLHSLLTSALEGGGHFIPGNEPRYPLHRRLRRPQGGFGSFADKNAMECAFCPPPNTTKNTILSQKTDRQRHNSEQRSKNIYTVLSEN